MRKKQYDKLNLKEFVTPSSPLTWLIGPVCEYRAINILRFLHNLRPTPLFSLVDQQ